MEKESNEIVLSASNKGNESNASITIKRIYTEEEKAELERKKEADRIAMEKQREAEKAEAFIKKQEETAAKIKAEEEKRLQEAEDTRRQEAEAIKKQKEDELALANEKKAFKTSCSSLSYKNLFRNISQYEDQNVYFTGKVIQVMGDGNFLSSMRVEVTRGSYGIWDDVVLLNNLDTEAPKILEEDVIKFWGVVEGERTYSTVLGAEVTVPEINAKIIEIAS